MGRRRAEPMPSRGYSSFRSGWCLCVCAFVCCMLAVNLITYDGDQGSVSEPSSMAINESSSTSSGAISCPARAHAVSLYNSHLTHATHGPQTCHDARIEQGLGHSVNFLYTWLIMLLKFARRGYCSRLSSGACWRPSGQPSRPAAGSQRNRIRYDTRYM